MKEPGNFVNVVTPKALSYVTQRSLNSFYVPSSIFFTCPIWNSNCFLPNAVFPELMRKVQDLLHPAEFPRIVCGFVSETPASQEEQKEHTRHVLFPLG